MSTEPFVMSHEFIADGHQLYLLVGIDGLQADPIWVPFATLEQGEWWWVVESSEAEAERTCTYLQVHVPPSPPGWHYIMLPCTMDDLLKLRDEMILRPVGFIHHVGWGATQIPPRAGYTRWSDVRRVEDLGHG
jgi:hypothetical protein